MPWDSQTGEQIFSREQVIGIIGRLGFRGAEADRLLQGLRFPATLSVLQEHMAQHGITHDSIISAMGGSP